MTRAAQPIRPTRGRRTLGGRTLVGRLGALWLIGALAACGAQTDDAPGSGAPPDGAATSALPVRAPRKPNLLLITLDTTRADALGAYGQAQPTTPHIDRMAAEGVRFTRAVSAAPTTLPSHATILTGKLPFAHGARSNHGYVLADANDTLAEVLARHGYATAAEIAAPVIGRASRLDQGFASYRDTRSPGVAKKLLQVVGDRIVVGAAPEAAETVHLEERTATDITDHGIAFIRAHRDRPFFLWLHYFDPHAFYLPPPEFLSRFGDDRYLGEVGYVDAEVGRVLDQLRGLDLAPDTLVVLTADHGEGRDEHGENTHSYFVYETTIHVPLVMWGLEALGRGKTIDALVRTADIAPTALDLLGLPPLDGIQGTSLRPLIDGEAELDLPGYGESIEISRLGASMLRFIRRGRWKYIHKVDPELYDIEADPGELTNLAAQHPEIVERLRADLQRMIASAEAPGGAEVSPGDAARDQLQQLGYLTADVAPGLEAGFASLELEGPDPLDLRGEIERVGRAVRAERSRAFDEAERSYDELWQRHGASRFGIQRARALIELDRVPEARAQLEAVVARHPDHPEARARLAQLLLLDDRPDEARAHLQRAAALDPCAPMVAALLAHVAHREGGFRKQHDTLAAAVERCAPDPALLNDFAYALATSPLPGLRDGSRAVALARRAIALDPARQAAYHDTLAAAHAERGDFAAAVASAKRAIAIAAETDQAALIPAIESHLRTLESGRPIRDPSPSPSR